MSRLVVVPRNDVLEMAEISRIFMFNHKEDVLLEQRNLLFWRSLLGHVQADRAVEEGATVLDMGCHRGGLLSLVIDRFKPAQVIGLEPLVKARASAEQCLQGRGVDVLILDQARWDRIATASVGLLLSHEVLPFIEDDQMIMNEVHRVLKPSCFAYFAVGCHTENPLWPAWKQELENQGHTVYDHAPLDIMRAAGEAGLFPSLRPLRETGWVHYNPVTQNEFEYPSATSLLDHQFKHKLLFRFERQP